MPRSSVWPVPVRPAASVHVSMIPAFSIVSGAIMTAGGISMVHVVVPAMTHIRIAVVGSVGIAVMVAHGISLVVVVCARAIVAHRVALVVSGRIPRVAHIGVPRMSRIAIVVRLGAGIMAWRLGMLLGRRVGRRALFWWRRGSLIFVLGESENWYDHKRQQSRKTNSMVPWKAHHELLASRISFDFHVPQGCERMPMRSLI